MALVPGGPLIVALVLTAALGAPLGPGAEPSATPSEVGGGLGTAAGAFGIAPVAELHAAWTPVEPVAAAARVAWVAPAAGLLVGGARWRLVHATSSGASSPVGIGLAAVVRGAAVLRTTGALDQAAAGVGPAGHLALGRLGLGGSAPFGVAYAGSRPWVDRWGLHLWESEVTWTVGPERRGRVQAWFGTAALVGGLGVRHRPRWGSWGVAVVGGPVVGALCVDVAWAASADPRRRALTAPRSRPGSR